MVLLIVHTKCIEAISRAIDYVKLPMKRVVLCAYYGNIS